MPTTSEPQRQFLAHGTSLPQPLLLVGPRYVYTALGIGREGLRRRVVQGRCQPAPVAETPGGHRLWSKAEVDRAAALIRPKPEPQNSDLPSNPS